MAMEYKECKMEKYTMVNLNRVAKMDMDSKAPLILMNIMDSLSMVCFGATEFLKRRKNYTKSYLTRTRSQTKLSMNKTFKISEW